MANPRTLQELRDEIRDRADVREAQWPDPELDRLINQQLLRLYRLLVSVNKDYYVDEDTVSVVAGTAAYSLPGTFWRLLGVDVLEGSRWYPLRRYTFAERNQHQGNSSKVSTRYRIMGENLRLRPTPTWAGTLTLHFIPTLPTLVNPGDTFEGFAGFEEYAVVNAALAIKEAAEEDVQALMIERKALYSDIKQSAAERDDAEPDRVRDVEVEGVLDDWNLVV